MDIEDLVPGTLVRANRHMEFEDTAVAEGDAGIVIGPAGCYGKDEGPVVRWLRPADVVVNTVTTIEDPDSVRVVAPAETGYLQRLDAPEREERIERLKTLRSTALRVNHLVPILLRPDEDLKLHMRQALVESMQNQLDDVDDELSDLMKEEKDTTINRSYRKGHEDATRSCIRALMDLLGWEGATTWPVALSGIKSLLSHVEEKGASTAYLLVERSYPDRVISVFFDEELANKTRDDLNEKTTIDYFVQDVGIRRS